MGDALEGLQDVVGREHLCIQIVRTDGFVAGVQVRLWRDLVPCQREWTQALERVGIRLYLKRSRGAAR
eukprot:5613461-Prorocentrum_lima.AAC.1